MYQAGTLCIIGSNYPTKFISSHSLEFFNQSHVVYLFYKGKTKFISHSNYIKPVKVGFWFYRNITYFPTETHEPMSNGADIHFDYTTNFYEGCHFSQKVLHTYCTIIWFLLAQDGFERTNQGKST